MAEVIDYVEDIKRSKSLQINVQKMQLSVTDLKPQYSHQSKENVKQEVSSRLYRIFKNYDV